MKTIVKKIAALVMLMLLIAALAVPALAAGDAEAAEAETAEAAEGSGVKAVAAAICVGVVAAAGAISMGWAISKSSEGISRQPEAAGNIRTGLMLGLVFIETAIIYALIVAILIIFVL